MGRGTEPACASGTRLLCVSPARCPGNRPLPGQPALPSPRPRGASRCSGQPGALVPTPALAHFRFRPRGRARKGQKSAGLDSWRPWREGASLGTRLGPGIHPHPSPSVAGRLKQQPPACLAAVGRFPYGTIRPRVPMGVGVLCCSDGSTDARGGCGGTRAFGCLRRKNSKTPPPCSRSPQHRGLQRPTRLLTRVASATALVSETRGGVEGKPG